MSITAMKMAVNTLEWADNGYLEGSPIQVAIQKAITALRTAIAEAEKVEPVGHLTSDGDFIQNQRWVMEFGIVPRYKSLYLAAGAQPAPKQEPFDQDSEREQFEEWYCVGAFDFERDPIGGKLCGDQWAAWKERAKRAAPVQAQEQRKPLTDELIEDLRSDANRGFNIDKDDYFKAFRDAEAAHNIKEQP